MSSILPLTRPTQAVASRVRKLPRIAVSLLGTGQVGAALLHQLAEQGGFAAPRLVALANSRRALAAPDGIAPADALSRLWDEGGNPGLEAPLAAVTNTPAAVPRPHPAGCGGPPRGGGGGRAPRCAWGRGRRTTPARRCPAPTPSPRPPPAATTRSRWSCAAPEPVRR